MKLSVAKFGDAVSRRLRWLPSLEVRRGAISVAVTICLAAAAFAVHLNLASAVSVLLLLTVVVAIRWGLIQATAVSLIAVGCLDFLFTQPLFKFSVHSSENLIALATFEVTALVVSRLSWMEKLHAQEQETQRQGIAKLYELSNAILLVDGRAAIEQLSALMREIFQVEFVDIWVRDEGWSSSLPRAEATGSNPAYAVFLDGKDSDSIEGGWSRRVLRIGTSPMGGMVLQRWEVRPPLADAAASLIAIAVERARSVQKQNRADAARNTEQLRTAVLDALAHGFKTPLTAIQTASSGLLAIGSLSATQKELVEIIDQESAMLSKLTTRLLQTAALDAREIRVRSSTISLLPLIENLVGDQESDTRGRIHISVPAPLEDVRVDAQLTELALAQLIDNAAKYSDVNSKIELKVTQDASKTVVTVSNEGPRIDIGDLTRIFERYYRGPLASRGPSGTGLGLSIVKKIAEAHGGEAWASYEGDRVVISYSMSGGKRTEHGEARRHDTAG